MTEATIPVIAMTGPLGARDGRTNALCPMARTLDVVGARSAFLILREALYGSTRFEQFVDRAGISEPVAAARLRELTADGLLEKVPYRELGQRTRHEYRLTEKGTDLVPVLAAMMAWGDRWLFPDRARVQLAHAGCGGEVGVALTCDAGHEVGASELQLEVRKRPRAGDKVTASPARDDLSHRLIAPTSARGAPAVPRKMRLLADISPLRESPAFRRLWAGSTLSSVGGALTGFAVPLQVYDITHSPFAVGAIGVAAMVPTLAIGLLGGSLADAVDRRKLVLAVTGGLAAVSAGLAVQAFDGLRLVWLLYALVAVESSLSAISIPARGTFVPRLLPSGQLPAGLALNRLSFQITLTAGPALAGLITAAPHLGLPACYLLDAISFAAALYGVGRLPAMPPQAAAARPGPRAVADGVRFIRHSPLLAAAFLADLSATVFGLPAALFPAINAERFGGDPRTLGLFTAAIGVGGLVSALLSGPLRHLSRQGLAMLAAVAVWGAAFAGFALASSLWLTLTLLAAAGAADTFTVVLRGSIAAANTPDELRGRVMAADYVVGAGGGQLGNLEAGALGSLTTPTISALAGGLATIAAAIVVGAAIPAFLRYRPQRHVD